MIGRRTRHECANIELTIMAKLCSEELSICSEEEEEEALYRHGKGNTSCE
jgi:hypothetical protein